MAQYDKFKILNVHFGFYSFYMKHEAIKSKKINYRNIIDRIDPIFGNKGQFAKLITRIQIITYNLERNLYY